MSGQTQKWSRSDTASASMWLYSRQDPCSFFPNTELSSTVHSLPSPIYTFSFFEFQACLLLFPLKNCLDYFHSLMRNSWQEWLYFEQFYFTVIAWKRVALMMQAAFATLEVFKSKFYYTDDDDLVRTEDGSWELTDKVHQPCHLSVTTCPLPLVSYSYYNKL